MGRELNTLQFFRCSTLADLSVRPSQFQCFRTEISCPGGLHSGQLFPLRQLLQTDPPKRLFKLTLLFPSSPGKCRTRFRYLDFAA